MENEYEIKTGIKEEAIERLEYIDRAYSCNNYYSIWDLKCIEILLSEYKRLQKENEELKNEIEEKELEIIGKEECTEASMREIIEKYYTANEDCVPIQKINHLIDERAFEIYTRDYGNIAVVDVDSLNELLEKGEEDNGE